MLMLTLGKHHSGQLAPSLSATPVCPLGSACSRSPSSRQQSAVLLPGEYRPASPLVFGILENAPVHRRLMGNVRDVYGNRPRRTARKEKNVVEVSLLVALLTMELVLLRWKNKKTGDDGETMGFFTGLRRQGGPRRIIPPSQKSSRERNFDRDNVI